MKKYAVYSAMSGRAGRRKVFTSKKDANDFYNNEVKKLDKKTGFVHVKNAETNCVIKGKLRDPRKKVQTIKSQCTW